VSNNGRNRATGFVMGAWIAFIVCGGFFIVASVKAGSTLFLIGSVIFLAACVVFIIPLIKKGN